jgi:hypothetical protein
MRPGWTKAIWQGKRAGGSRHKKDQAKEEIGTEVKTAKCFVVVYNELFNYLFPPLIQ